MPRRFYAHKILRLISEPRHSGREKCWARTQEQVTVQYEKASRWRGEMWSRTSIWSRT